MADKKILNPGELYLSPSVVKRFNETHQRSEELNNKLEELAELARVNRERAKSASDQQLRIMFSESVEQIVPVIAEGVKTIKALNDLTAEILNNNVIDSAKNDRHNKLALSVAAGSLFLTLIVSTVGIFLSYNSSNSSAIQLNSVIQNLEMSVKHEKELADAYKMSLRQVDHTDKPQKLQKHPGK